MWATVQYRKESQAETLPNDRFACEHATCLGSLAPVLQQHVYAAPWLPPPDCIQQYAASAVVVSYIPP